MTTPEADPADVAEQAAPAVPAALEPSSPEGDAAEPSRAAPPGDEPTALDAPADGLLRGGAREASEADLVDQTREVELDDEYR